ncbi:MAG: hypothetical protein KatS3mg068_0761 [Candidatus Sericytochromatia bacterium]|nr:MAG: hypothetical protein KatS3mg068_0761 [Candidatus Sericytochromatia bacterium]
MIEILFFTNRVLIPSLWLYNINDAYKKSFEKNINKEETDFEQLSFNINLLSINF